MWPMGQLRSTVAPAFSEVRFRRVEDGSKALVLGLRARPARLRGGLRRHASPSGPPAPPGREAAARPRPTSTASGTRSRATASGSISTRTARSGRRSAFARIGVRTWMVAGSTPSWAGSGSETSLGPGPSITTGGGWKIRTTAGCGCRRPRGEPPGWRGVVARAGSDGLRFRPMPDGPRMPDSRWIPRSWITRSPSAPGRSSPRGTSRRPSSGAGPLRSAETPRFFRSP
jgi:hypothetical protein